MDWGRLQEPVKTWDDHVPCLSPKSSVHFLFSLGKPGEVERWEHLSQTAGPRRQNEKHLEDSQVSPRARAIRPFFGSLANTFVGQTSGRLIFQLSMGLEWVCLLFSVPLFVAGVQGNQQQNHHVGGSKLTKRHTQKVGECKTHLRSTRGVKPPSRPAAKPASPPGPQHDGRRGFGLPLWGQRHLRHVQCRRVCEGYGRWGGTAGVSKEVRDTWDDQVERH